jgi:hypothetical protein
MGRADPRGFEPHPSLPKENVLPLDHMLQPCYILQRISFEERRTTRYCMEKRPFSIFICGKKPGKVTSGAPVFLEEC